MALKQGSLESLYKNIIHWDVKHEMAPKVVGGEQTLKADVWSLFVTMVWTLDCQGFREKSRQFLSNADIYKAIEFIAASEGKVFPIKEMAVPDPEAGLQRMTCSRSISKWLNQTLLPK
ncbi:hypothetical protein ACJ73_06848 [Blastomyces percursus]|uniref:Uncharacterized protein n=1 Tax=Blastomyces percursus TaxID=1658174 RepID=A0A1J9Q120_9EURO|nr:hypothetical protein ACJ73_06848 [Blastomyces percursus]